MVKDKASVINIIQEMLQKGESEEKIFSTLKEIGITEDQIKNLLLISKADTFTLLKSEISKMTNDAINEALPKYKDELKKEIETFNKDNTSSIKDSILNDVKTQENEFEQKQLKEFQNIAEISANTKEAQDSLKNDLVSLDEKIEEKTMGSTKNIKIMRIVGFIVGLILLTITIYKFVSMGLGTSIDFMIFYVLNTVAAIILLILSLI